MKKYFTKLLNTTYDTHKMVEVYMLLVNNNVAKTIALYDMNNSLFRTHDGIINNNIKNNNINNSDEIMNKIHKLNEMSCLDKAYYKIGTNNCMHNQLDINYYTHFTSPLRRYCDNIIHRQLWNVINNNQLNKISSCVIFMLNYYDKIYKMIQQYENILLKIDNLNDKNNAIINAYIYDISYDIIPYIKIYIPCMDLTHKIKLCNIKILYNFDINITNTNITIINKINNKTIKFNIFECIKIKVIIMNKSIRKIQIDIIEPNLKDIFL
jgi:ribonuclease R